MTLEQYRAVWAATEKAAMYLRKQGALYSTVSVASGCQEYRLVKYTVADASEKARKHIEKAYPLAMVVFADPRAVEQMERAKRAALPLAVSL